MDKLIKISDDKLNEILANHKLWIDSNSKYGNRADLRGANLHLADLNDADLRGADLRGADLSGADLRGADLRGADLRGADLRGADLRGADLTGADLRGAILRGANLNDADLRDADLRGANLHRADLLGAILNGADLHGANLDYSCLPLWCGSLSANFDDRQIIQFVYHIVKSGLNSTNTSDEIKSELAKLIDLANKFHRADECGKIKNQGEQKWQKY